MPRPESNKLNPKDFDVRPQVPESKPTPASESLGQKIRRYAHEAANIGSGGAIDTVRGATKNMNYGMGGSFNHAREDD